MKTFIKYLVGISVFILIPNFVNIYRLSLIITFGVDGPRGYREQFGTEAIIGKSNFFLSNRLADITLYLDLGVIALFVLYSCVIIYQGTTNTIGNKKILILFITGQVFYWLAVKILIVDFLFA